MFKITKVQVKKIEVENNSRILGIARVIVDDCFAIEDIRIIKGKEERGVFIAFPNRKTEKGYKDMCHPLDVKTRKMFEDTILDVFKKLNDTED